MFENVRCGLLWSRGYRYSFWHLLARERTLNDAAERLLADVNLESRRDLPAGLLSYAEQRALEIGITIAGGADTILYAAMLGGLGLVFWSLGRAALMWLGRHQVIDMHRYLGLGLLAVSAIAGFNFPDRTGAGRTLVRIIQRCLKCRRMGLC